MKNSLSTLPLSAAPVILFLMAPQLMGKPQCIVGRHLPTPQGEADVEVLIGPLYFLQKSLVCLGLPLNMQSGCHTHTHTLYLAG